MSTDLIRDRNIEWERKRIFLDPLVGSGWTTAGTVPVGLHTGDPVTAELGTYGFLTVKFEAASDEWVHKWPVPADCDVGYPIYFRVHWATEYANTNGTASFILTYHDCAEAEALAAADTALDTPIALTDACGGTAKDLNKTAWGSIAADTIADGDTLILEIEIDAVANITIASDFVYYLGLEIEYTPKRTVGAGCCNEANTPHAY